MSNPESKSFMSQCQFVVEPESNLFEVLPDVTPVVPLDVNNDVHLFLSHPKQAIQLESQCQKG